jgi:hypothetical protein
MVQIFQAMSTKYNTDNICTQMINYSQQDNKLVILIIIIIIFNKLKLSSSKTLQLDKDSII